MVNLIDFSFLCILLLQDSHILTHVHTQLSSVQVALSSPTTSRTTVNALHSLMRRVATLLVAVTAGLLKRPCLCSALYKRVIVLQLRVTLCFVLLNNIGSLMIFLLRLKFVVLVGLTLIRHNVLFSVLLRFAYCIASGWKKCKMKLFS